MPSLQVEIEVGTTPAESGRRPRLSVIIPTCNRAAVLRHCLDGLFAQTCDPAAIEIIVADDGSTDDTAQVAASLDRKSVV